MKSANRKVLELVERRLDLVLALVRLESEWRNAFIGLRLTDSERVAAEEEILCREIHALDLRIANLAEKNPKPATAMPNRSERTPLPSLDSDSTVQPKIHAALERMGALHVELKRSNAIRQAILKRSELTIRAFRNLYNSFAPTYGAPAALQNGTMYEENV
jgi:hypothetical protein